MDLLLHFKVNEGDENNINIQEYMLYGDVETKSEKCGLSDYTNNSQTVERPDWMEEDEILIDRDNDYVLLRDPDENVKQIWTASGEFLSTVQLENETVDKAMEEYYHNISKGGFYIPDRIKEGYMEEDYDNLSKEDIEL